MSARCEKTELLVDQCAHCKGNDKTVEEQDKADRLAARAILLSRPTVWFPAIYRGACNRCGEYFDEGAAIRRVPTATGFTYIAECCVEVPS